MVVRKLKDKRGTAELYRFVGIDARVLASAKGEGGNASSCVTAL
jgi:hypothetical protein